MNSLDSRVLRYTDCFGQKFSVPGLIQYQLTTTAGTFLPVDNETFTIDVNKPVRQKQRGRQHNVIVKREGRKFVAEPAHLEIEAGDMVLWHAPEASTPGFAVRGEGQNFGFDSSALTSEAVYTHAFGTPGEYVWIDANGGPVTGLVEVQTLDPADQESRQKWLNSLKEGSVITIRGTEVSPTRIQILTGQTVFWAVEKAEGLSITDARLVRRKNR